jgi:hypothetical protein
MAGDIGINERAIILPEAGAAEHGSALLSLEQAHGRAMHHYGPRVVIAEVSEQDEAADSLSPFEFTGDGKARIPTAPTGIDGVGQLGLSAFGLRQSPAYAAAKAKRPHAEEDWDAPGATPPCTAEVQSEVAEMGLAPGLSGAPTSSRLTGSVAVGIIIVEGPTAKLKFSAAERTKVIAEVQNGLGWLGSRSGPGGISWVYDIRIISLSVSPNSNDTTLAQKENRWRNPAMAQLGYPAGMAGVQQYVNNLRSSKNTNWAYCAYFTKYPLGHFAYASIGGPRMVMAYDNDGWGPDNIDRVFAHETGHIFGAPDEYKSSNCNCGGQWGHYQRPNSNCEACAPGGGVACIMKGNSWEMCEHTPFHLGFVQERKYSGVFRQGAGGHAVWADASWTKFQQKWSELSGQGLRLRDLKIAGTGNATRYSGVFQQGTGGYGLWVNATWNGFLQKWNQWNEQGLRLVDLEITGSGTGTRYSGVWVQGTGGYGLWAGATWDSFIQKWNQWNQQGLRLIDLKITGTGSSTRYSGVWRQGTGGYGLWVNATLPSFLQKWNQWNAQGLRLVDLEITGSGSGTRYSGVWQAGAGAYGLWLNASWASFIGKWEEWSQQGLRLIDLDVTGPGTFAGALEAGAEAGAAAADGTGFGVFPEERASFEEAGIGKIFAGDDGGTLDGEGIGQVVLLEGSAESEDAGFGHAVLPDSAEGDGQTGMGRSVLPEGTAAEEHSGAGSMVPAESGGTPADAGDGGKGAGHFFEIPRLPSRQKGTPAL